MTVAVVDYNAGNVRSVLFALERIGHAGILTSNAAQLRGADKVIFPGVGEANTTMRYLRETGLDQVIKSLTQPVLGVCLGMQLLCTHSEENDTDCLGIIPQRVRRFRPADRTLKVPHMGWNTLTEARAPLFDPAEAGREHFYFVHSYYVEPGPHTVATCDYVLPFSAALQKDNFHATQFHPEKSGSAGEGVLRRFLGV